MRCPNCKSVNINQYRMITGKIWCNDCGFSAPSKEKYNPFLENDRINVLLEEIESIKQDILKEIQCQIGKPNLGKKFCVTRLESLLDKYRKESER